MPREEIAHYLIAAAAPGAHAGGEGVTPKIPESEIMFTDQFKARFVSRIESMGDGCWIWRGAKAPPGYGQMRAGGAPRCAHRISYRIFVGPIPDGLEIDHLCRVLLCVNPKHLEPVTHRENTLRGTSPTAKQAQKIVCNRGHVLPAATKHRRRCMICRRLTDREWRRRASVTRNSR